MAVVEQDFSRKERVMTEAKNQGVNFKEEKYVELDQLFSKLTVTRNKLKSETTSLTNAGQEMLQHIGDKKKIPSTDPRFEEVEKFRGKSEDQLDEINDDLASYQKTSNKFRDVADGLGFRWINVNQFKQQLIGVIGMIKLQCDSLDGKLTLAGVKARTLKDRDDVTAMRKDVQSLRGVESELRSFLAKFEKSTVGKTEFVLTPKHPQAELLSSLGPIQERAEKIIDSFNAKAKAYQN